MPTGQTVPFWGVRLPLPALAVQARPDSRDSTSASGCWLILDVAIQLRRHRIGPTEVSRARLRTVLETERRLTPRRSW